jgi:hypothetical protein
MSGRSRLPSGAARRASQRHHRHAAPAPTVAIATEPRWRPGDRVVWRDCAGQYLREVEDGQAHVLIGARTYLVAVDELRPG